MDVITLSNQVERRLKKKDIHASVTIQKDMSSRVTDDRNVHIYVDIESIENRYGYSFSLPASEVADESIYLKEIAIAANKLAREIHTDFSTKIEHNGKTVVIVEDLNNTLKIKCLDCQSEVELEERHIRQSKVFSKEPESVYFGNEYLFETTSGYDSLTEEEKSIAKLYVLGKLDKRCDCDYRKI